MKDTLFTDNFKKIKTDTEIQKIIKKFPKYDPYYIASGCIKERKEFFENLWLKFKPYADNNFIKEIKTNFHSRSREMYVGNLLLENGLSIKSNNEGPDFIIDDSIYIECVTVTKGNPTNPNSVPEMIISENLNEASFQNVPINEIILRFTQAIQYKAVEQYMKRKKKKRFKENTPFIIAINTGDLGYLQGYLGIPLAIKALFGLEFLQITQDGNKSFSWRNDIKKGEAIIPVDYFTNDKFNFISGVLFSEDIVLYYENKKDNCIFINNPFAKNPVNKKTFSFLDNWQVSISTDGFIFKHI